MTSGVYDITLDLTLGGSYNPAFVTANGGTVAGAEAALVAALTGGKAYLNLHSNVFPGGEIRGFYVQVAAVPLPTALPAGLMLVGALIAGRRLRRRN